MTPRSILVVDDQDSLRALFQQKLAAASYHVVTAADGREASQAIAREKFDLVLTDLVMPDKDGIEVIRELHKTQPDLPIIAMSGGGHTATYLKAARALGAIAILEKPFSDEALLRAITLAIPEQAG